jgi:hypothetical protein
MLGQLRPAVIAEKHKLWKQNNSVVRRAVTVGFVAQVAPRSILRARVCPLAFGRACCRICCSAAESTRSAKQRSSVCACAFVCACECVRVRACARARARAFA